MLTSSIHANVVTFNQLTQVMFDTLKDEGSEMLGHLEAETGSIDAFGVKADYQYEAALETLTVAVNSKPFFLTMESVTRRITFEIAAILTPKG